MKHTIILTMTLDHHFFLLSYTCILADHEPKTLPPPYSYKESKGRAHCHPGSSNIQLTPQLSNL